ncbi:cyclin-like protein interacting with PHO85 [Dimargaris xerosporica]|nr:cyclin-like protein interacting with PHO85 [Dimargaris xerosporica]
MGLSSTISNHPVSDAVDYLAATLDAVCASNDQVHQPRRSPTSTADSTPGSYVNDASAGASVVTLFHSRAAPPIAVKDYIVRIATYLHLDTLALLSALVYMHRAVHYSQGRLVLSSLTVHRLLMASVVAVHKFTCDIYRKSSRYARIGGISRTEMNNLEIEFLFQCQFDLMVSDHTLCLYFDQLMAYAQGHKLPKTVFVDPFECTGSPLGAYLNECKACSNDTKNVDAAVHQGSSGDPVDDQTTLLVHEDGPVITVTRSTSSSTARTLVSGHEYGRTHRFCRGQECALNARYGPCPWASCHATTTKHCEQVPANSLTTGTRTPPPQPITLTKATQSLVTPYHPQADNALPADSVVSHTLPARRGHWRRLVRPRHSPPPLDPTPWPCSSARPTLKKMATGGSIGRYIRGLLTTPLLTADSDMYPHSNRMLVDRTSPLARVPSNCTKNGDQLLAVAAGSHCSVGSGKRLASPNSLEAPNLLSYYVTDHSDTMVPAHAVCSPTQHSLQPGVLTPTELSPSLSAAHYDTVHALIKPAAIGVMNQPQPYLAPTLLTKRPRVD